MDMENAFETQARQLYIQAKELVTVFLQEHRNQEQARLIAPAAFEAAFFCLIDKVNVSLMEDKDNFYGYFLFQMTREIRFDMASPTGVHFKGARYVLYFNPLIFLTLTLPQMESSLKHEILHILSLHLLRAKSLKTRYGTLAINMAMDIVVNTYLDHLPPYATTLEWVNTYYSLKLLPFETFEYYVGHLQIALDLLEENRDATEDDSPKLDGIETLYEPEKTHALWEETQDIDEKSLKEFTEKALQQAQKTTIPDYVQHLLAALKDSAAELPWNVYLKRLIGTRESVPKKITTRRNRRQPERLDLRGQLRSHTAHLLVALDISGSISDEECNQALKEVLAIVKNSRHEITVVECDSEIRRVYPLRREQDIKPRLHLRGSTRFSPVFAYANHRKTDFLIYFTDGQGEEHLSTPPKSYKTLWVISGKGEGLSLKEPYGTVKKLRQIEVTDTAFEFSDTPRDGYSMNHQEKLYI